MTNIQQKVDIPFRSLQLLYFYVVEVNASKTSHRLKTPAAASARERRDRSCYFVPARALLTRENEAYEGHTMEKKVLPRHAVKYGDKTFVFLLTCYNILSPNTECISVVFHCVPDACSSLHNERAPLVGTLFSTKTTTKTKNRK